MARDIVDVLSISWAGNTARKLVGNILNALMMDQLGFSQVHCPCPHSVFTMSWVKKLVFVPSVREICHMVGSLYRPANLSKVSLQNLEWLEMARGASPI